jgi:hypothetical protein
MRYIGILLFCVIACFDSWSQIWPSPQPVRLGTVTVVIEPCFGQDPLILNDKRYIDPHGDTLTVSLFKFYMTHITMDSTTIRDAYLYDAEDSTSFSFSSQVPPGSYSGLSFIAGVDSIANTSGANGGDLDPSKNMYWAWNSGYIMAKLEGESKVCKTLHHAFEFHVGGYMPPYNTARPVSLIMPVTVQSGQSTTVHIKADVSKWFKHGLEHVNSIVIPGKQAAEMADNYALMFSVGPVTQQTGGQR